MGKRTRSLSRFELLVVLLLITIVLLLGLIAIPFLLINLRTASGILTAERSEDARIAKATSDVSAIDSLLDNYKLDVGTYPSTDEGLVALIENKAKSPFWNGPYLKNGLPNDPWGSPYIYSEPGVHGSFDVSSAGPDGIVGTSDDIGNWNLQK